MANQPQKSRRQLMRDIADLDARRQNQIRNQVGTINRVMQGGSYDDEMRVLHEDLAAVQHQLEEALLEIRRLRGDAPARAPYDLGN